MEVFLFLEIRAKKKEVSFVPLSLFGTLRKKNLLFFSFSLKVLFRGSFAQKWTPSPFSFPTFFCAGGKLQPHTNTTYVRPPSLLKKWRRIPFPAKDAGGKKECKIFDSPACPFPPRTFPKPCNFAYIKAGFKWRGDWFRPVHIVPFKGICGVYLGGKSPSFSYASRIHHKNLFY